MYSPAPSLPMLAVQFAVLAVVDDAKVLYHVDDQVAALANEAERTTPLNARTRIPALPKVFIIRGFLSISPMVVEKPDGSPRATLPKKETAMSRASI
jgi:hypothetical protein